jgi:hypothetical protein
MKIVLLHEKRLGPIPTDIQVIENWGDVEIYSPAHVPAMIQGDHVYLEGSPDAFKAWLKPFDGVWVGEGIPQLQKFKIMHVA